MNNESIMDIKQQIMNFSQLEDIRHIDAYLDNHSSISFKPNGLELEETGFLYSLNMSDGCSFKYYVPYEKIVYISVVYNCPKSLNSSGE